MLSNHTAYPPDSWNFSTKEASVTRWLTQETSASPESAVPASWGDALLSCAIHQNSPAALRALLAFGFSAQTKIEGVSLLALAFRTHRKKLSVEEVDALADIVTVLLEEGVDPASATQAPAKNRRLDLASSRWNPLWNVLPDETVASLFSPPRRTSGARPQMKWLSKAIRHGNGEIVERLWNAATPETRLAWASVPVFQRASCHRRRPLPPDFRETEFDDTWLRRLLDVLPASARQWKSEKLPVPEVPDVSRFDDWPSRHREPPFPRLWIEWAYRYEPDSLPLLIAHGALNDFPESERFTRGLEAFIHYPETRKALHQSGFLPKDEAERDQWLNTICAPHRYNVLSLPFSEVTDALKSLSSLWGWGPETPLASPHACHGQTGILYRLMENRGNASSDVIKEWLDWALSCGYPIQGSAGSDLMVHALGPWLSGPSPSVPVSKRDCHYIPRSTSGYEIEWLNALLAARAPLDGMWEGDSLLHRIVTNPWANREAMEKICMDTSAHQWVHARDLKGATPVHRLMDTFISLQKEQAYVQNDNPVPFTLQSCLSVLLKAGAPLDAQDDTGQTPIHVWAEKGPPGWMPILHSAALIEGAHVPDKKGWTPAFLMLRRCLNENRQNPWNTLWFKKTSYVQFWQSVIDTCGLDAGDSEERRAILEAWSQSSVPFHATDETFNRFSHTLKLCWMGGNKPKTAPSRLRL